jgi:hypothetical protein
MSMGGSLLTRANVREATISITVTRADGSVEHMGVVSYWHRNPLKRTWFAAKRAIKERFK